MNTLAAALTQKVSSLPMLRFRQRLRGASMIAAAVFMLSTLSGAGAGWTITEGANPELPGNKVDIRLDGKLVARFIHGPGQFKPYLHVCGADGELLTNSGLDSSGKTAGQFPHHRGIFIGWKISSELGTYDLWHMNNGGKMEVVKFERLEATKDAATLVAKIHWRAGKKDAGDSDLLLTETRTLVVSRARDEQTQVDALFSLRPARDLNFAGDLQHSGVHFRAANEVAERKAETAYLYEPDKVVKGREMKWCRLFFPIGPRWYTALEMNGPDNPVDELSMRDYGRFGYFFKKNLKKDEPLNLNYRFILQAVEAPAEKTRQSAEQAAQSRAECEALYQAFAKSRKP